MPGIYGFTSTAGDSTNRLLQCMEKRMLYSESFRSARWIAPGRHAGLGVVSLTNGTAGGRLSQAVGGAVACVLHGEIYDIQPARKSGETDGAPLNDDNQAAVFLQHYLAEGPRFFARVEGKFSAAIWDGRAGRLTVVTDPFGILPLYYCKLPGHIVFGSEIKALLAHSGVPRQTNVEALSRFITFGHLFFEETLIKSVALMPPATWIDYEPRDDRISTHRYWTPHAVEQAPLRQGPELLDHAANALQQAINRRLRGSLKLGIALSGGLDARTILGLIDHSNTRVTSLTLGVEGSLDHLCAARLSRLTNRDHHAVILGNDFLGRFERHLRDMVYLTDGQYRDQCIVMPTLPLYREYGIEALLRGHGGELMHMDKAYTYSVDREALTLRSEHELAVWLLRRLSSSMINDVSRPLLVGVSRQQQDDIARDTITASLRSSDGIEPAVQRIPHVFLDQRVRRETGLSLALFGSVVETRVPYLDKKLVEVMLAMPHTMKHGDCVQRHILQLARPAFLRVTNANTGAPMGASRLRNRLSTFRLRALRKLGIPGYQPYEHLALWLRRELNPCMRHILLSERCLGRGTLNPDTVREVVESHSNGTANHTYLLLSMMIVETGQRLLNDGEVREAAAA